MTAEQFRDTLKRLGLNQGQAAEALEISRRHVSRYAMGRAEIPKLVRLALLGLEGEKTA